MGGLAEDGVRPAPLVWRRGLPPLRSVDGGGACLRFASAPAAVRRGPPTPPARVTGALCLRGPQPRRLACPARCVRQLRGRSHPALAERRRGGPPKLPG